jgi:hypothetical protein
LGKDHREKIPIKETVARRRGNADDERQQDKFLNLKMLECW